MECPYKTMKPVCVIVCWVVLSKIQYPSAQPHVHCSHISWVSLMPDWSEFRAKYQLICLTLSKSPALSCSLIKCSTTFSSLLFSSVSLSLPSSLVRLHSFVASGLNSRDKGCSYTQPLDQSRFTPAWLSLPWVGILFSRPPSLLNPREHDWGGGQSVGQTQANHIHLDLQHRLSHLTSTSPPPGHGVELPHMHLPWPDLLSEALCWAMTLDSRDAVFNSPLIHSHQYFTALTMISLIKTLPHISLLLRHFHSIYRFCRASCEQFLEYIYIHFWVIELKAAVALAFALHWLPFISMQNFMASASSYDEKMCDQ